jgi:hypothetical protein
MWGTADGLSASAPHPLSRSKGGAMYHWMDGWDWFWMSFIGSGIRLTSSAIDRCASLMVFWIVVLGALVYVAVKPANHSSTNPARGHPAMAAYR